MDHNRRIFLPILDAGAQPQGADHADAEMGGASCSCDESLSQEEVAVAHAMRRVKLEMREAWRQDDRVRLASLREEFAALRESMERLRRARLDRLGLFNYD